VLAALLALVPLCYATGGVLGVSPDSTQYLATARSVLAGQGLSTIWWAGRPEPLTQFPPLYPLCIALVSALGPESARAAWLLHALLVPTNVLLIAWCASRIAGGTSRQRGQVASVAALAGAVSTIFATVHAMLWSEPLFTAMLLGTLALLARSVECWHDGQERLAMRALVAAGILAGMATMTRYAGLALVGASCLALVLLMPGDLVARARRAIVFAGIALTPFLAWALFNRSRGAAATDRSIVVHPISATDLIPGIGTVSRWLVPYMPWSAPRFIALACVVLALAVMARSFPRLSRTGLVDAPRTRGVLRPSTTLALVLALFIICYAGFLIVAISFADRSIEFDDRLLYPALPPAIALTVGVISWLYRAGSQVVRAAIVALAFVYVASQIAGIRVWAAGIRQNGADLTAVVRAAPALLDRARALPEGSRIYSNMPEAIYYGTGRIVRGVPRRFSPTSLRPNPTFVAELDALADSADRPTYVVFFDAGADRTFAATAPEVEAALPLQHVDTLAGGRIVTLRPRRR
jgi:hypothetical protein